MAGDHVSPRKDIASVKHRKIRLVQAPSSPVTASFDHSNFTESENDKSCHQKSETKSSQMLTTADLISAAVYAWDRARWPHTAPLSENNSTCKTEVVRGCDMVCYSTDKGSLAATTSADDQSSSHDLNSKANFVLRQLRGSLEHSKVNKNIPYPLPSGKHFLPWGRVLGRSGIVDDFFTARCLLHTQRLPNWGSTYSWMSQVNSTGHRSTSDCCTDNCSMISESSAGICMPSDSTVNVLSMKISGSESETAKPLDLSFRPVSSIDVKTLTTTCSRKDILLDQNSERADCNIVTSSSDAAFVGSKLASLDEDCENGLYEDQENQEIIFGSTDSGVKMSLSAKEKPNYKVAKQEHAFAGAMAGIVVSLCLHPIDTIKTVLQSCRADQKPLHIIGCSIIAERGMSGLYRGISSNILSSAPISAVYTYTYESVKGHLLPLLPKEYSSVVHCTSGGCASIATSFIFTPSERIKQQMQVGSHYRNCWNAFIHVVQNGGVRSLYAGWGAVLCRNIPHSVIKFYTYESLKQIMMPSFQSNTQANVVETLVCGGLAGSTASLFTTPFDVVKTRLQTQVPGSTSKCHGVLATLSGIGKHEGLKGLYRGLTPRLVMYMIQGALFFASYESFKQLFSLEVPRLSARDPTS
ncbi:probable S-adenosylmethionine carrier 2, chloroplastic [Andrographis paniculata]|uniref:probable S-adenosylmethionine carrier 2, chloroplastic n=1 Tax=Andrographis paniculata TaxID=175694 RepID=UPI0021E94445|nr:probable S-adenosylmethionine carrier 2, chloroplastic [Andrographis paniculata]